MKVTLNKIKNALRGVEGDGWDGMTMNYLNDAIDSLNKLKESLDNVSVKGRENIDALLGCMMGLEMIIGEEEEEDG